MIDDEKKRERGTKRLEELLLDDSNHPADGRTAIDHEVRVVGGKRGSHFSSLIILFVFCFFVLGGGYLLLQKVATPASPQTQDHHYYVSPKISIPERQKSADDDVSTGVSDVNGTDKVVEPPEPTIIGEKIVDVSVESANHPVPLVTVTVGPLVSDDEVSNTILQLKKLGFQPEKSRAHRTVTMVRLLEGTYPPVIARRHLHQLEKKVKSAFLLPQGDQLSVFAGSFHQKDRAKTLQSDLAKQDVRVTLVDGEVALDGTVLTVIQADQQTAREVAQHLSDLGLKTTLDEVK